MIALFAIIGANAQIYQQQFAVDSTAFTNRAMVSGTTSYVHNTTPTNAQLTYLASTSASTSVGITSNAFRTPRTNGGNMYAFRNVNVSASVNGAPTLYYEFEFNPSSASSSNTSAFTFWVGNGFTNGNSNPSNIFATFVAALSSSGTPPSWKINNAGTSYSGNKKIVWVLNRSGATIKYKAPTGVEVSLVTNAQDVWVNDVGTSTATRELNNSTTGITAAQPIQHFGFRSGATGNPTTFNLDNILVDSMPKLASSNAASSIGASSFTANWTAVAGVTGYR